MSYHYNKQKKKKRIIYFALGLLIMLALFTPLYSYVYDILEKPFKSVYTNTEELKSDSKNFIGTWVSKKKLIEENQELEKQLGILEVDNLRTQYLESLLEKKEGILFHQDDIILSSVLKKNNTGMLTILGGKDTSFSVGDLVFHYDGTLVGKIDSVFGTTSTVALFVQNGMESRGVLFPQDISITMMGNGNALVAELDRGVEIAPGDIVYSQNTPGRIIGSVSRVNFDPRNPSKGVFISPIHSINSLQEIGVIKTTTE